MGNDMLDTQHGEPRFLKQKQKEGQCGTKLLEIAREILLGGHKTQEWGENYSWGPGHAV